MAYDFQPETQVTANSLGAIPAGSMEQARAQVLNLKPANRFYYIHHPDAWHLVETKAGFEWMPRLRAFRLTPGVNGVRQTRGKNPKADDRAARVNLADRGYTVIPYDSIDENIRRLAGMQKATEALFAPPKPAKKSKAKKAAE